MKHFVLVILSLCSVKVALASGGVVAGRVIDENRDCMPFSRVAIFDKDSLFIAATVTDNDGLFRFEPDKRPHYITASSLGYHDTIETLGDYTQDITLRLTPSETTLSGVTVTAESIVRKGADTYYYPSKNQKDYASGGIDLLKIMGMTELYVNPLTDQVSTTYGEGVAYFINGVESTKEAVEALGAGDIKKIELLKSPAAPQFNNVRVALNYITVRYDAGGYTKAFAKQELLSTSGKYDVYSKYDYKRMQYDLSAGLSFMRGHHNFSESVSKYKFGAGQELTRATHASRQYAEKIDPVISFRARYANGGTSIANTLGVMMSKKPAAYSAGDVTFSGAAQGKSEYSQEDPSTRKGIEWSGAYLFPAGKGLTLSLNPYLNYFHLNESQSYSSTSGGVDILNHYRENALQSRLNTNLSRMFGRHSFGLALNFGYNYNGIDYSGSQESEISQKSWYASLGANANLNLGRVFWYINAWLSYETTDISSTRYKDWVPHVYTNLNYQPCGKLGLGWSGEYSIFTSGASYKSPVIISMNETEAIEGNPELKNYTFLNSTIYANYDPARILSLSAFAQVTHFINPVIYDWNERQVDGRTMMVREYLNSGTFTTSAFGLSGRLNLFDGRLSIGTSPKLTLTHQTGLYGRHATDFYIECFAQFRIRNVLLSAFYVKKHTDTSRFSTIETPQFYSIMATWRLRNFMFRLSASNIFNSSYLASAVIMKGNKFSTRTENFSPFNHRDLHLTVIYNISYGRKKAHEDNMDGMGGMNSAIVK